MITPSQHHYTSYTEFLCLGRHPLELDLSVSASVAEWSVRCHVCPTVTCRRRHSPGGRLKMCCSDTPVFYSVFTGVGSNPTGSMSSLQHLVRIPYSVTRIIVVASCHGHAIGTSEPKSLTAPGARNFTQDRPARSLPLFSSTRRLQSTAVGSRSSICRATSFVSAKIV